MGSRKGATLARSVWCGPDWGGGRGWPRMRHPELVDLENNYLSGRVRAKGRENGKLLETVPMGLKNYVKKDLCELCTNMRGEVATRPGKGVKSTF